MARGESEVIRVIRDRAGLAALGPCSGETAVVMTMGALHEGHASLIRAARERAGSNGRVVTTVFVNPRQFGAGEDFDRYPRTLDDDVALAAAAGADVVFAPEVNLMYPSSGSAQVAGISVDPGPLGCELEGASRPGHFAGVLTVVAKLLHLTSPDVALFGEKDYQQWVLVRSMVAALDFPVDVVGVPTVREPDGLAMSSRNRYLSPEAREAAAAIPRALRSAQLLSSADAMEDSFRADIARAAASASVPVEIDYAVVRDLELRSPPLAGPARMLAAVIVDGTRLLDNVEVHLGTDTECAI